jgi:hypothetical protein
MGHFPAFLQLQQLVDPCDIPQHHQKGQSDRNIPLPIFSLAQPALVGTEKEGDRQRNPEKSQTGIKDNAALHGAILGRGVKEQVKRHAALAKKGDAQTELDNSLDKSGVRSFRE